MHLKAMSLKLLPWQSEVENSPVWAEEKECTI